MSSFIEFDGHWVNVDRIVYFREVDASQTRRKTLVVFDKDEEITLNISIEKFVEIMKEKY